MPMPTPFDRVLIANRGEIAVRVIRSCRALGLSTVAVYSDADREALHVRLAGQALHLGAAPAAESYLRGDRIIEAALTSGAQAIHPGYGFLSENAAFARAVQAAGLIFIGPDPESIAAMGDKSAAKVRMLRAGVPCIPGYQGDDQSDSLLLAQAQEHGFPVMIKAAAGGGGRGMRLVRDPEHFQRALASARSEAANAFGDGRVLLEKALVGARHVEIQVFGDRLGHLVHLGERDCSIQRRNQKIVEEAPSPAVDTELRARMGAAAVAAARAVDYVGAGTIEFMLTGTGEFYFLEMNTRLQVEHAVTEMLFDLDLVEWQLRIARGEPLPLTQSELDARRHGYAIEVRLCSEDPAAEFQPQTGGVLAWAPAIGPDMRVDHGLTEGQPIGPHYDSLQAKLIARGATREDARRTLLAMLGDTLLLGVPTNQHFLAEIIASDEFASGDFSTDFIGRQLAAPAGGPTPASPLHGALVAVLLHHLDTRALHTATGLCADLLGWQSTPATPGRMRLNCGESALACAIETRGAGAFVVTVDNGTGTGSFAIRIIALERNRLEAIVDGNRRVAHFARDADQLWLRHAGVTSAWRDRSYQPAGERDRTVEGRLRAPMDGRIIAVHCAAGAVVRKGQVLVVLEAMKMQFQLVAPSDGQVETVACAPGQQVKARHVLAEIRA